MNVRLDGRNIGTIEQVQHGYWYATHVTHLGPYGLGAFTSRNAARNAVIAAHYDQPIVGRIQPTILHGLPPRGQA